MNVYRYFGLIFGRVTVTVSLDSADLGDDLDDHAAVWAGINASRNRAWVQGGVEIEQGDPHPFAYVEVGLFGRQASLRRFPHEFGKPIVVKLRRTRDGWVAAIPPLRTVPVRIGKGGTIDAMLETYGLVDAFATINGKTVRG